MPKGYCLDHHRVPLASATDHMPKPEGHIHFDLYLGTMLIIHDEHLILNLIGNLEFLQTEQRIQVILHERPSKLEH